MGLFSKTSELKKHYKIDSKALGSGNFATVKKCWKLSSNDNTAYALKIIDKSKVEDMGDIEREIDILAKADHPHIIRLYEFFDEKTKMNLVMELVTGGELFDHIVEQGTISEKQTADIMQQLCGALKYIHELEIVHRDLKPENILMQAPKSNNIKVADFGLARVISKDEMMRTACGTPGYVAPEILKNKGYDSGAVDMWSTGVILYIMLCGFPPFHEEELPALFDQILKGRYDFPSPWWDHISPDGKAIVEALLTLDPKKRLTAENALKHPWMLNNSDAPLNNGALKKFQLSRKLKKAGQVLLQVNKMAKKAQLG